MKMVCLIGVWCSVLLLFDSFHVLIVDCAICHEVTRDLGMGGSGCIPLCG